MSRPHPTPVASATVLKRPIRVRILGWLAGQSAPRTKRAMGRALSLSNAAVHDHVKKLAEAGLVAPAGTRPGPNSITEKLFAATTGAEAATDAMGEPERAAFYLRCTLDSIAEMHREAEQSIRSGERDHAFFVGCFGAHAAEAEIRTPTKLLDGFHAAQQEPGSNTRPLAITFGLVPSGGRAWGDTQKVLDVMS